MSIMQQKKKIQLFHPLALGHLQLESFIYLFLVKRNAFMWKHFVFPALFFPYL